MDDRERCHYEITSLLVMRMWLTDNWNVTHGQWGSVSLRGHTFAGDEDVTP